jgi:hypothetical protein
MLALERWLLGVEKQVSVARDAVGVSDEEVGVPAGAPDADWDVAANWVFMSAFSGGWQL